MNFVLDFFVDKESHPFDIKEMRLLFASSFYFYEKLQSHKSPTWRIAREFVFDDGNTGVHFTLRYNKPEAFDLTVGKFSFSGLCLEMELPKPCFFGYEAMKVVAHVMKSLNLLAACSSHMPENPVPPQRYEYDELVELWLRANEQEARDEVKKGGEFFFSDKNKMLYWWRFTTELPRLRLKMKESNIEVPEITLCSKKNTSTAVTVCEWPGMRKSVIPVVDYVVIEKSARQSTRVAKQSGRISKRLKPSPSEARPPAKQIIRGMTPFNELVKALKGNYEQEEKPLPHIIYNRGMIPVSMKRRFNDIRLIPMSRFELIDPDEIIDVIEKPAKKISKKTSRK